MTSLMMTGDRRKIIFKNAKCNGVVYIAGNKTRHCNVFLLSHFRHLGRHLKILTSQDQVFMHKVQRK